MGSISKIADVCVRHPHSLLLMDDDVLLVVSRSAMHVVRFDGSIVREVPLAELGNPLALFRLDGTDMPVLHSQRGGWNFTLQWLNNSCDIVQQMDVPFSWIDQVTSDSINNALFFCGRRLEFQQLPPGIPACCAVRRPEGELRWLPISAVAFLDNQLYWIRDKQLYAGSFASSGDLVVNRRICALSVDRASIYSTCGELWVLDDEGAYIIDIHKGTVARHHRWKARISRVVTANGVCVGRAASIVEVFDVRGEHVELLELANGFHVIAVDAFVFGDATIICTARNDGIIEIWTYK